MLTRIVSAPVKLQAAAGIDEEIIDTRNYNVVRKMLCKPVSYDKVQNIVCTRHFVEEQVMISMRLLCLSSDLPVIHNWLPWEYTKQIKKEAHVEQLHDMYDQIANSGTSQSFMVLMNNINLAQADVYYALADDIGLQYQAKKGDFKLQLLMKPDKVVAGNYAVCLMQAIMDFLFSFEEVNRIVITLDEHEFLNNKVGLIGFVYEKEFIRRQKLARLYTCSRETFHSTAL